MLDDVFARAMEPGKLGAFFANKNSTFLAWLMGFIDGELHNRASRRHLSREVSFDEGAEATEGDPCQREPALRSNDGGVLEVSVKNDLIERLRRLVETLPEGQRAVVTLRHFCGLTFEEIAGATGKPSAEAAWQAYSRAVAALRRGLDGGDGDR